MRDVIDLARTVVRPEMTDPLPMTFRTTIVDPTPWTQSGIEATLGLELPPELVDLWNVASSLRLFQDVRYGQWGLVIVSPENAVELTQFQRRNRSDQIATGDLVIGELLGDSDLLLLRCDKQAADFGAVLVELPIYDRSTWPRVGPSLKTFLQRYLAEMGDKFWESTASCARCCR